MLLSGSRYGMGEMSRSMSFSFVLSLVDTSVSEAIVDVTKGF